MVKSSDYIRNSEDGRKKGRQAGRDRGKWEGGKEERTKVQKVNFGGGGYLDLRLEFEDRCKGAEAAAACESLDGGGKGGFLRFSVSFIMLKKQMDVYFYVSMQVPSFSLT